MGTTIIESNRLDASYNVVFYRPGRTLYVQAGLDPVTRTCAITHELGHTHYAHDCSTQQAEHKADKWAADHFLHEAAMQHSLRNRVRTNSNSHRTRSHPAYIKNLAALPGWSHHIPMLTTKPRPCD